MHLVVHTETLLATLAQSGATMVAIIAGLLVARLVPLVGERDSWRRRIEELRDQYAARSTELHAAEQRYLDYDAYHFTERIEDEVIRVPDVSFEQMYELHGSGGRTEEELRPYFDELRSKVARLREGVELLLDGSYSADDCESIKGSFPNEDDQDLLEKVISAVAHDNRTRQNRIFTSDSYFLNSALVPFDAGARATYFQAREQRRAELRQRVDEVHVEVQDTELGLNHALRALQQIRRPGGILIAFVALAIVTIFGVILPLSAMVVVSKELSRSAEYWFVAVFIASVFVFIGHLCIEALRLTRRFNDKE